METCPTEPWIDGHSAAEWMVHHGRFPPAAVLEIARQMAAALAAAVHGDISAAGLLLTDSGRAVLLQPGLRGTVRPEEGYAHADLPPEAYDYLAPERIVEGTPPSTAADIYACGCLWWHLLCGRPPLPGGDSLAKLRAVQEGRIPDVRRLAPDVPPELAAAIAASVERDPARRPESMARLAAMLGPPTLFGRQAVVQCLRGARRRPRWPAGSAPMARWSPPRRAGAALAVVLLAAVALGSLWNSGLRLPTAAIRGEKPAAVLPESMVGRSAAESHLPRAAQGGAAPQPAIQSAIPQELVLPAGGPIDGRSLKLRAGQRVRGRPEQRPLVLVPPAGLSVAAEDVRFEDIDFLWDHRTEGDSHEQSAAVIHLQAGSAEFRRCSFQSAATAHLPPAAIRWTHPPEQAGAELVLPSGRVRLHDCLLRGVEAGLDCRTAGALCIEIRNTLHLGGGPLVRLDHCPRPDEPLQLTLAQVTLRESGPLLDCRCEHRGPAGEIAIQADGAVLALAPRTPLLLFRGPESPEPVLGNLRWNGQGSLVTPQAVVAAWAAGGEGQPRALDDAAVAVAGLVRSQVEFAGKLAADPAASRVVRWQAPLQSTEAPGIDPARLPRGMRDEE